MPADRPAVEVDREQLTRGSGYGCVEPAAQERLVAGIEEVDVGDREVRQLRFPDGGAARPRRCHAEAVRGVYAGVVVELYSNSSSAPNILSSTALRAPSEKMSAAIPPTIKSVRSLRPRCFLRRLPRNWSAASRSDWLASRSS